MHGTYGCHRRICVHENWTQSNSSISCFSEVYSLTSKCLQDNVSWVIMIYTICSARQGGESAKKELHQDGFNGETNQYWLSVLELSLPQDQYADSPWEIAFLCLWGQSITPVVAEYLSWNLDVVTHAQLLMSAIRLSSVTFAKKKKVIC